MPNLIIAKNLKKYRKLLGLTQDALGDYLGISRGEVNYYENGKRDIPVKIIEMFSDIAGINPSDLLEESDQERDVNLSFAFRAEGLEATDLVSIASFKRIVKNYLKLQRLINE